jgi:hypothetical protein
MVPSPRCCKMIWSIWYYIVAFAVIVTLSIFIWVINKKIKDGVDFSRKNRVSVLFNNMDKGQDKSDLPLESFTDLTTPYNVQIKIINESTVSVNFNYDTTINTPDKFLLVLAKYTNDNGVMKRVGDSQFMISDEKSSSGSNKICTLIGKRMKCEHVFTGINSRDASGNPYMFKIGVSAVTGENISNFATPSNIGTNNMYFTTTKTANAIANIWDAATKQDANILGSMGGGLGDNSSGSYGAGGQFELIKNQLGGYPDNLVMDKNIAESNLLTDLLDKSMTNGVLNVNVTSVN